MTTSLKKPLIGSQPVSVVRETIRQIGGRWWIAHTRSRMEKALARDLQNLGIDCFLPLVKQVRYSGGRKRHREFPLFGGYVFFAGDEQARYRCMCTGRLCQTIEVSDQAKLVEQLSAIEAALAAGICVTPAVELLAGQQCRILDGPLMGAQGKVVRTNGQQRVLLSVDMLGQGAIVDIETDLIERLDETTATIGQRTRVA
jgi:transcription antitermination factor NusG